MRYEVDGNDEGSESAVFDRISFWFCILDFIFALLLECFESKCSLHSSVVCSLPVSSIHREIQVLENSVGHFGYVWFHIGNYAIVEVPECLNSVAKIRGTKEYAGMVELVDSVDLGDVTSGKVFPVPLDFPQRIL